MAEADSEEEKESCQVAQRTRKRASSEREDRETTGERERWRRPVAGRAVGRGARAVGVGARAGERKRGRRRGSG